VCGGHYTSSSRKAFHRVREVAAKIVTSDGIQSKGVLSQRKERVLRTGDQATGTTVLEDLYAMWGKAPVNVDLQSLWAQLGLRVAEGKGTFDDHAPFAAVRMAIVEPFLLREHEEEM
jgi:hypothetical protein